MSSWETILYPVESWSASQLSIVRYRGGCTINGKGYSIVNKDGVTLVEVSHRMEREHQDGTAIPPGEPADLVLNEWIPVYKALGRDRFLKLIGRTHDLKVARRYARFIKYRRNVHIDNLNHERSNR